MIKVVNVIPIAKGINKEMLSYFSGADLKAGSIVHVPVRTRSVPALVVSVEDANENKADIKSKLWNLRKIESKKHDQFFTEHFMQAVGEAADYFATTPGVILNAATPKSILSGTFPAKTSSSPKTSKRSRELFVLQSGDEERLANHKSLIREEFAKGGSVFFCLPTIEDIKHVGNTLPKGIEPYTFILHGGLTAKEMARVWNAALEEKHPVLIIATGTFLCIPRLDIGTIIVERESSRAYKIPGRPNLDIRTFSEFLAKRSGARLLFGDTLLRAETIWRYKNGDLVEFAPLKFRTLSTAEHKIVDMRHKSEEEKPVFEILGADMKDLIGETRDNSENLFIFSARRGLFPTTSCGDCGNIVMCKTCNAPIALHSSPNKKENFFLCHKCGEKRNAAEHCAHCGSWKLVTLGIGTERVAQAVSEYAPDAKVLRLDADSAKTPKKAADIVKEFQSMPGSILIGTELALPYLSEARIDSAAVASIDALFSIPDFRINERVLQLLLSIRKLARRKFLIQTRTNDTSMIRYALSGNLIDFYREEIAERKNFGYPPFSTIIKVTLKGEKQKVRSVIEKLVASLSGYNVAAFPAFTENAGGAYTMHVAIKLDRKDWVDKELLEKLRSLPQQFEVAVDPETLL